MFFLAKPSLKTLFLPESNLGFYQKPTDPKYGKYPTPATSRHPPYLRE